MPIVQSKISSMLFVVIASAAPLACGGSERGGSPMSLGGSDGTSGARNDNTAGVPGNGAAGSASGSGGASGGTSGTCGSGDANLPPEPTTPAACATLSAAQSVAAGSTPSEASLDTARIQAALNTCGATHALRLTTDGVNDAFVSGPLTLPSGVSLWVDAGTTLYASLDASLYGAACVSSGNCTSLITAKGTGSGVFGSGTIDGQGGEPMLGQTQSWWQLNGSGTGGGSPALIQASGAHDFTLHEITLHNSPKFHVKLDADGFVVWGVTIKTPSVTKNSQGTALTPALAHNTDGIDPGESASNGYIVCSNISDGDDQIAIKGGNSVMNLTIAHNHFLAGHGMSIGSETNGGVSDVNVYDLSIDGLGSGLSGGSSNGIRIKSDPSRGGLVTNITYSDVCVRNLSNPILLTPHYTTATGTLLPEYTGITIQNFRSVASSVTPTLTLDGLDASHLLGITLDNVVVDGVRATAIAAAFANVTLGPGGANFMPTGTTVTVTSNAAAGSEPNACAGKWVTF